MDKTDDVTPLQGLASAVGTTVHDPVAEAVELYPHLRPATQRSLRAMAILTKHQVVSTTPHAAGCEIVAAGLALARQRGRQAAMLVYPNGQLPSEQAVEDEAVRLTREAWTAPR